MPTSAEIDQSDKRFILNMGRIAGLTRLVFSGIDALKPIALFTHDGVGADIFRAAVVFLHAAFEDLLRSQIINPKKRINFSATSDIDKALKYSHIDATPFKSLYPPLGQLAKRRHQIVHHADIDDSGGVKPWNFVDPWQVVMWHLAVISFSHQGILTIGSRRSERLPLRRL